MRYGRIQTPDGQVHQVRFEGDAAVADGASWTVDEVRILSPVAPGKLLYVGMNYVDHAAELGVPLPEEPLLFFKPPTAVIGDGAEIVQPHESARVDYEGEFAVVIGRRARNLSSRHAMAAIAGYTIANDVTARDFQQPDTQWTKAKAWDTFAPLGPWVETSLDPSDVRVETYLNGERRQESSTRNLCFGVHELVAYASRLMTLEPGDVIATGTPAGIGPMRPGDVVEVHIEGIGRLRNPVVADR